MNIYERVLKNIQITVNICLDFLEKKNYNQAYWTEVVASVDVYMI